MFGAEASALPVSSRNGPTVGYQSVMASMPARLLSTSVKATESLSWVHRCVLPSRLRQRMVGLRDGMREGPSTRLEEMLVTEIQQAPPNGTPSWVDLGIPDHHQAMEFYGAVFGWEFMEGPPETGHYTMCLVRGKPVAAVMKNPDPDATEVWWNVYFATNDCDGTVKRVTDAGGQIPMAPMDVMDQGRMAICSDPVGGQFGLWEGRAHIGAGIVNEPGALAWNELVTAQPAEACEFYTAVFDYTLEKISDGGDYTVVHRPDGTVVGGIQGDTAAPKSSWLTYFAVEDTDAALDRATTAGGTITVSAQDTPYGRMAGLRDPFGAEFRIIQLAIPD
jgi:uncharacterized protein